MGYDVSWDRPHRPSDAALWQESDCYWFYDENLGVGGFHRIGQTPNVGKGQITLFAFARDGERYRLGGSVGSDVSGGLQLAITESDRWETGHRVGTHVAESLGPEHMRFTWDEEGCAAELEFSDSFHTPRNWSKTGHSDDFMDNINSDGHLECAGRLRGPLRIGSTTYEIDALAHRDRSWGFRDNSRVSMHRYRMFSGTVGPEFSIASFFLDLKDGPAMVAGFVARDGVDHDIRDLRVLVTFDSDAYTPMAATAIVTLETDEVLKIDCTCVQGFVSPVTASQSFSTDNIATITYAGKTGFVDLEMGMNPGRGTYVPTQADVSLLAVDAGLSKSASYAL